MADYTLNDLRDDAFKRYEALKKEKNRLYHLARELGFSAIEAMVLQNKSEPIIRRLAKERTSKEVK